MTMTTKGASAPISGGPAWTDRDQVPVPVWSGAEKAEAVRALREGRITAGEAQERYGLTPEEIAAWERTLNSMGVRRRRTPREPAPAV
jgi:transposase-like protein